MIDLIGGIIIGILLSMVALRAPSIKIKNPFISDQAKIVEITNPLDNINLDE